jgi:hypothetical protein
MKELIRKILKEETEDHLKTFFFKMWDKQKEKDGVAFFNQEAIEKLGLIKDNYTKHNILQYYIDYVGGRENQKKEFIEYIESGIFNSLDIKTIQDRLPMDFKFVISNVEINNRRELFGNYVIIEGSWIDIDTGESFSIITGENEIDDMSTFFELKSEIADAIDEFVDEIGNKFGLILQSTNLVETY